MRHRTIEPLEPRRLLAGVTIIAPTWDSTLGGYVLSTDNNMIARLGASQVPEYTLVIAPNKNGTLAVQGITHDSRTATMGASPDQQVLLTIDYTSVSTNPAYPLSQVAALVTNYMENTPVDGVRLAELPIHEIGVSRACDLMDEIARSFGVAGIWVDQETYNDPHPVYVIGDPPPTLYDNVAFVDNYWRTSGTPEQSIFYNGTSVNGAYNLELTYVQADSGGYGTPHEAPAGWYDATIDLNSTNEIIGPVHADWWGTTPDHPPRDKTGFYYTSIIGGPRPLSGVWSQSGGTGVRTFAGEAGPQWPNVTDVSPTNGTSFAAGSSINIHYLHQDRDDGSSVTFYLDTDQNPYRGNFTKVLGSASFGSGNSATDQLTGNTSGVPKGTYYIAAVVNDGQGHQRVSYCTQAITITSSSGPVSSQAPPITSHAAQVPVTVAAPAQASPVTGTISQLSVLGGGSAGESNLTYLWSVLGSPTGAADPVFSVNGTNSAKNAQATFSMDGTYLFRCTISDNSGDTVTSDVSVTVQQTPASLTLTPTNKHVHRHKTLTLHLTEYDQFGHRMKTRPLSGPTFSILHGHGSIGASTGIFTASKKTGGVRILARADSLRATVLVTVVA